MNTDQKTFIINTMSEAKYLELSAAGKISDKQLNIVDDNDTNRTVIASYDLLDSKITGLSITYDGGDSRVKLLAAGKDEPVSEFDASEFIKDGQLAGISVDQSDPFRLLFGVEYEDGSEVKTVGVTLSGISAYADSIREDVTEALELSAETLLDMIDGLGSTVESVSSDYLKGSDRTELENEIAGKADRTDLKDWALSADVDTIRDALETEISLSAGVLEAEISEKTDDAEFEERTQQLADGIASNTQLIGQVSVDITTAFTAADENERTLRESDITAVNAAAAAESAARSAADEDLLQKIQTETEKRESGDGDLAERLEQLEGHVDSRFTAEIDDRSAADNLLGGRIDETRSYAETAIAEERSGREAADGELGQRVTDLGSAVDAHIAAQTARDAGQDAAIESRKSVVFRLRDYGLLENITENPSQVTTSPDALKLVSDVLDTVTVGLKPAVIRAGDWKFDVSETIQAESASGFACVGVNAEFAPGGITDPYICKFTVIAADGTVFAVFGDTKLADAIKTKNVSQWTNDAGYAVSADVDSRLQGYYAKGETYSRDEIAGISADVAAKSAVTAVKLETAETGYFATYEIRQGGVKTGTSINIPKDFLVKSGAVAECSEPDVPIPGLAPGDKYIDFTVNAKEGGHEESHIYIDVRDLTDVYTGSSGAEISVGIGPGNGISAEIAAGGVTSAKIKDLNVTMPKLGADVSSYIESQRASAVSELDVRVRSLSAERQGGVSKTAVKITETSGIVSADFRLIQIEQSQVTDLEDDLSAVTERLDVLSTYGETAAALSSDGYALSADLSSKADITAEFQSVAAKDLAQDLALKSVISGLWNGLSSRAYQDAGKTVPKTSATITVDDLAAAMVNVMNFVSAAWGAMKNA